MQTNSQAASRDYLLDNMKFVLILLVVYGHFFQPYIKQSVCLKTICICIYSFHMPVFVFISGYFSKSTNSNSIYKMLTNLLIPYIVFSILWDLRDSWHAKTVSMDIFTPPFHLWYLLSLFCWKLLLPVVQQIRHYLIVSIIVALLVGFSTSIGWPLSLSRTISLFPFFVLGTLCSSSILYRIHNAKYFAVLGIISLLILGYYAYNFNIQDLRVFYWAQPYRVFGFSNLEGMGIRAALMFISVAMGLTIIVATPSRRNYFSTLGSRTIVVFTVHGFLVPTFSRYLNWNHSLLENIVILTFPLILTFFLSQAFFERYYSLVFNYISSILLNAKSNSPT